MKIKEIIYLCLGCFLIAAAYNIFFLPNDIVSFGISGLSVVIKEYGIEPISFIFITDICLVIVGYFLLGKHKIKNCIIGSLVFPLFALLTKNLYLYFPTNNIEMIVNVVFGAVLAGVGFGFVFKTGYTTGGTDIIHEIVSKYFNITAGKSKFIVDGLIVLSSILVFTWEKLLYGFIILYVISIVVDRILLGISNSKVFYILTEHEEKVKKYLLDNPGYGITIVKAKGGYSNEKKSLLMAVVPTRDYTRVKHKLRSIDKDIFFLICDTYEVSKKGLDTLNNSLL